MFRRPLASAIARLRAVTLLLNVNADSLLLQSRHVDYRSHNIFKVEKIASRAFSDKTEEYKNKTQKKQDDVIRRNLNRGDAPAAERAYVAYRVAGGAPSRPLLHAIMQGYAKNGEADSTLTLLAQLLDPLDGSGPPNQYSYGFAITALKRSFSPLYRGKSRRAQPVIAAKKALDLYNDMIARGLQSNVTIVNETMDCLGKAGLAHQALELFHRSFASSEKLDTGQQTETLKPTVHTFSILINASATAGKPDLARHIFENLMPLYRITPTLAVWNSLLVAQTSVDGVYATWQEMQQTLGQADSFTERILINALASNPQLAAEVINELRTQFLTSRTRRDPHGSLLSLDLHGHSRPAALVALHQRLEAFVNAGVDPRGDFVVITGKSNAFSPTSESLKMAVRIELERQSLNIVESIRNPGRLLVPRASLSDFVRRQSRDLALRRIMRAARTRYLIVSTGVAVLAATTFLLPRLSPWL